jgi:hypothetical protein
MADESLGSVGVAGFQEGNVAGSEVMSPAMDLEPAGLLENHKLNRIRVRMETHARAARARWKTLRVCDH